MKFDGFHHIGLAVNDEQKSLEFYKKLGGVETFSFPMGDTGKKIYLVDIGGHAVVEIIPRGVVGEEENVRFVHIAIETDDARAAYELALKAGAVSRSVPNDANLGSMAVCTAFVYGPDKEIIEFFEVKS
jgi:lactoylglutathione lyase